VKATASITIDHSIGDVFTYLTNVENMPRWVTGVRAARMSSDRMGAGARYVLDYIRGWRSSEVEIEVTEYDPPTSFGFRASRGPFPFEGRTELKALDEATEVTNIIEADPDSVSTRLAILILGPLLRRSERKRLTRELEQLRSAIEA
jgi:uncharacterized protein YndB with AHSA1/START domain